jgi:hypothetical protein
MANERGEPSGRDPYRDNDDVRDKLDNDERSGVNPDTKSEARGDARENIGNHSRGTAANPTPPDRTDRFDDSLDDSGRRPSRD